MVNIDKQKYCYHLSEFQPLLLSLDCRHFECCSILLDTKSAFWHYRFGCFSYASGGLREVIVSKTHGVLSRQAGRQGNKTAGGRQL
jgi:hypothetical protein